VRSLRVADGRGVRRHVIFVAGQDAAKPRLYKFICFWTQVSMASRSSFRRPSKKWSAASMNTNCLGSATVSMSARNCAGEPNWSRVPLTNSFGFVQVWEKIEAVVVGVDGCDGQTEADHGFHAIVGANNGQADGSPERKSGEDQRKMKFLVEPVQGCRDIFALAVSLIVLALTESCAAEVEAQDGESEAVQGLHGVEDDFVVQGSAENRMRMANQRGVSGMIVARVE